MRCDLLPRLLDSLGNAQLRQRPAGADHGYGAWRGALAVSRCARGNGVLAMKPRTSVVKSKLRPMPTPAVKPRKITKAPRAGILELRPVHLNRAELHRTATRLLELSPARETEVEVTS